MEDLDQLIEIINKYPSDIKAEVLIADLIKEGFSHTDFLIYFDSLFKRRYSKDVLKAEKIVINDIEEILAIRLARDGLYDLLPEGLFHASSDEVVTTSRGMASDSKKESGIEKETRKFFQPFENELFYQKVQLELQERSILQKLNDNSLDDFFLDFWKIDRSLPDVLIIRLSALLPFVREIAGDFRMTASCLGSILSEEVDYSIHYKSDMRPEQGRSESDESCSLGNTRLGVSMIPGQHSEESFKAIRFIIGPLKNSGIEPYLENGNIAGFIDCFCNYFVPMEITPEFEVIMDEGQNRFVLSSDDIESILGYSTAI